MSEKKRKLTFLGEVVPLKSDSRNVYYNPKVYLFKPHGNINCWRAQARVGGLFTSVRDARAKTPQGALNAFERHAVTHFKELGALLGYEVTG